MVTFTTYALTAIGLTGVLALSILWVKITSIYFMIRAVHEGRHYKGYFMEYFSIPLEVVFSFDFLHFFPCSILMEKQELQNEEMKSLYQRKIRLEKIFWMISALGLLTIPVFEFLIKPYLL